MIPRSRNVKIKWFLPFHCVLLFLLSFVTEVSGQSFARLLQELKYKHKTDVVIMKNGDRNTGEIKKLEFGVLHLKSDLAVDTLKLDWEKVEKIYTPARFQFETKTSEYYIGTISPDLNSEIPPGELGIVLDKGSIVRLKIPDIISIREMGRSILSRINLSLDAGAGFTSANSRTQSNINLYVSFEKPKYSGSLSLSSQFSGEPETEKTSRHELQVSANRYLKKDWEVIILGALLKDNQQELELRSTIGAGAQRIFYESSRTLFYAIGGLVYTNENYFEEAQLDRNNAEALAALGYSTYRFRGSSFNSQLFMYFSLSDPGRVRVDTNLNWRWEIIGDFYWKISLIDNYDNRPPETGINHNLSINTSVGYSF